MTNRKGKLIYSSIRDNEIVLHRKYPYFHSASRTEIPLEHHGVYEAAIPQIVKALYIKDIKEARKRVSFREGYRYSPSPAYFRAISKFFKTKHHGTK